MWQRAKILEANACPILIGTLIWVDGGDRIKCPDCGVPAIGTYYQIYGVRCIIHLKAVELLAEFQEEIDEIEFDGILEEAEEKDNALSSK